MSAVVTGAGVAFPATARQDDLWRTFFADYYADGSVARRVWENAGVRTRHAVVDPRDENVSGWSTSSRMRRFAAEALPLGKDAVASCLADAGLDARDVGVLIVVSSTGYVSPGLDICVARDLAMHENVQRLHVGHMGCYAAIPALAVAADAAVARRKAAVVLCVELTSLHVQPPTTAVDQIVAHALFSDGAAAVAVTPEGHGLEVVDVAVRADLASAGMMTWDVTDLGFRMGLSPQVPDVVGTHVRDLVCELLQRHALDVREIAAWAVHPGGPRIIDVVADRLHLTESDVAGSRTVLAEHGNCSSATVLVVLEHMRRERALSAGDYVVALTFGPGLTLYGALLRQR